MTFDTLGLSESLLRAVRSSGYTVPTPIQANAIPAVLKGTDVMAAAQTGTGKTAGFILPILQKLSDRPRIQNNKTRALVLTPTRELAAQVQDSAITYGKHLNLTSAVVFGGVKINPQMMKLRRGVDILVATPGRLIDLYQQNAIQFDQIEILVLDEADRMLDMGFIHDIKKIMALLPKKRQNLMFSATFSDDIRKLAKSITNNPIEIDVAPRNSSVASVQQVIYPVDKARKAELLSHLIQTNNWYQVLVFARTKHGADKLVKRLSNDNINATAIHGNKSQPQRTKALAGFKKGKFQVLVATDIAARGIDIDQLSHVINIDLPNIPEDYVHRIGRTGRAGATGEAISLVSADEIKQLQDIERLVKRTIKRVEIDMFEPKHALPDSRSSKPVRKSPGKKTGHRAEHRTSRKPSQKTEQHNQSGKPKENPYGLTSNNPKPSNKKKQRPGKYARRTRSDTPPTQAA